MPQHRYFVSHSRFDDEGRLFLSDLFARFRKEARGRIPYFYSLQAPEPPHAQRIRTEIGDSEALVVLLSDQMRTPHTHSWVSFEVGVAAAHDLPVIVIESEKRPINFHVPGATILMRRPRRLEGDLDPAWKSLLETGGRLAPNEPLTGARGFWDSLFEAGLNAITADNDETGHFRRGTCQRENCRTRFYVPSSIHWNERYPCPSCRDGVASILVELKEHVESAQHAAETLPAPSPRPALAGPRPKPK